MFGIIGEDRSDAETLRVLVHRLSGRPREWIQRKGYHGCGEMLKKGAKQLQVFQALGCGYFVVAHDADGDGPDEVAKVVRERIVVPSQLGKVCIVIPVQEIEAWIIADLPAVSNVIRRWTPSEVNQNPETIRDVKEHLEWLSRGSNSKPRYDHATHNERVAEHLNLDRVYQRCISFRTLKDFVDRAIAP